MDINNTRVVFNADELSAVADYLAKTPAKKNIWWVKTLLDNGGGPKRVYADLVQEVERAAVSCVNNYNSGNGPQFSTATGGFIIQCEINVPTLPNHPEVHVRMYIQPNVMFFGDYEHLGPVRGETSFIL